MSSKVSESFHAEENEFALIESTIANSPPGTHTIKRNVSFETQKNDTRASKGNNDNLVDIQTGTNTQNVQIKKTFHHEEENKNLTHPSDSDNSYAPRIQNTSRNVEPTRKQCTCFPYFKYIVCGKVYNN